MSITYPQLISGLKVEIADLEQRVAAAHAPVKRIADNLRLTGRSNSTPAEDIIIDGAKLAFEPLKVQLDAKRAELGVVERFQAEDAATDLQLSNTHSTGVYRDRDGGGFEFRDGRTTRTGGASTSTARWALSDGRSATVERGQRFGDHAVVQEHAAQRSMSERPVLETHGGLGNLIRSMSTSSGSAVVPTSWSADIIDKARNHAAVLRAGAEIIPMATKVVQIGRLTGDPSASFRTEGSTITASDPAFDNVTLTANTLSCLVVGSLEWFQDAMDVENVVSEAIAKAVALELDLNALYGGVIAGSEIGATGYNRTLTAPPSPRGVLAALLATAPANVLGGAANGTTQNAATPWNEILDTVFTPTYANETPNGLIWSSQMARRYAGQYDTLGQPLRTPDALATIPKYVTNQIPSNMTVGTSTTNQSDVFCGDWTQLLIGQRLDFQIQTLTERYAELGQVGIVATWRGDIQPARPKAFSVYRYLKNV